MPGDDVLPAAIAAATDTADDPAGRASAVRRLRNEFRGIQRRDYFPPAERDLAQAAIQALAAPGAAEGQPGPPAGPPARRVMQAARQAGEETA